VGLICDRSFRRDVGRVQEVERQFPNRGRKEAIKRGMKKPREGKEPRRVGRWIREDYALKGSLYNFWLLRFLQKGTLRGDITGTVVRKAWGSYEKISYLTRM